MIHPHFHTTIKTKIKIALCAAIALCAQDPVFSQAVQKPNIVIVLADDLWIRQTSPYLKGWRQDAEFPASQRYAVSHDKALEAARKAMPTLDKLAAGGMLLALSQRGNP